VITTFFNAAQPLIRYDQGDLASWGDTCSCGRHLPNLLKLVGRSAILFRHPDGRLRSSFMGAKHRELLHCRTMQVAQVGPTLFEVRYVPLDRAVLADEETFAARVRELYFDDAQVHFRRLDEIPPGPNGKTPEFVSEWHPAP
jgi:phenylacetate-CoA ligase